MHTGSNNTNKLSPQEPHNDIFINSLRSNNTNKLSPQELCFDAMCQNSCSNNTNKLSPQELSFSLACVSQVQIIQINLVLKNLIVRS